LLPPNDPAIAGSLNNLGRIFLGEHRYVDARKALEESLHVYWASLSADHPRVLEGQALLKFADSAEASNNRFVKVFDVLDSGYRSWPFPAFGLIFVGIGIIIFAFPRIIKATGIPYFDLKSPLRKIFRYVFLGFAILWTAIAFFGTYSQYLRHKALAQGNSCGVVEGPVEHFVPMPITGHAEESFSVRGIPFRYSDFIVTDGFNNTSSHGGPIKSDSYVRICYDPAGNIILRLEIRDFKGELKDYAKIGGFFPSSGEIQKDIAENTKNPAINPPWYSNLFIVLYILDFVATYALFVPYLRTFFRLKTTARNDCAIARPLEPERKIKLRNSTIYWDTENQTIWLRPRGFNLFQVPLTVAALKVDALGKSVIESEIRFSSGFPVVMILFLWTAYRVFSGTMPADPRLPLPTLFVGLAGLMFLISGFFMLGQYQSRMEKLIDDALAELGTSPAR